MYDFRLSKTQRNELAELARECGLSLADFTWTDETHERDTAISRLKHVPTGATVAFAPFDSDQAFWLQWWPNFLGGQPFGAFRDWLAVERFAATWFAAVQLEHQSADLWSTAQDQRAWIADTPTPSANSPFTKVERELLAQHLRTIEVFVVTTLDATDERQAEVRAQLKYLTEATERLGRFDWRGLAVSTLIAIVLQLGLTPERANNFMSFGAKLLGPFVNGAAQLLQGR